MTLRPASQVARCAYEKMVSPVPIGSGLNELLTVQVPHCPDASDEAAIASALVPGGPCGGGAGGCGAGGGGAGGGGAGRGAGAGGEGEDEGGAGEGEGPGGLEAAGGVGEAAGASSGASSLPPPPQPLSATLPMLSAAVRMNSRRAWSKLLSIVLTIKNPGRILGARPTRMETVCELCRLRAFTLLPA
jgi:hypothetical protein